MEQLAQSCTACSFGIRAHCRRVSIHRATPETQCCVLKGVDKYVPFGDAMRGTELVLRQGEPALFHLPLQASFSALRLSSVTGPHIHPSAPVTTLSAQMHTNLASVRAPDLLPGNNGRKTTGALP